MIVKAFTREFWYDGVQLADPNPEMSIDDVRDLYSGTYAELTNATYKSETVDDKKKYTFKATLGTNG